MPVDSCSSEGATHYACDCTLRLEAAEVMAKALRLFVDTDDDSPVMKDARAALAAWEGRTDAAVRGEKEESDAD